MFILRKENGKKTERDIYGFKVLEKEEKKKKEEKLKKYIYIF